MQDILETVDRWMAEEKKIAMATVVKTWGSSPRSVGAKMVISDIGEFEGSVSGGCVEGAVITKAIEVSKSESPTSSNEPGSMEATSRNFTPS